MLNTEQTENGIEIYEHEILYFLDQYIAEREIEDMRAEPQSRWNAALLYIYKYAFKGKDVLKSDNYCTGNLMYNSPSNNNAYDIDKVNYICDLYISICYEYDKEISIMGFSKLTGITTETIYEWRDNTSRQGLSTAGSDIYKKLSAEREESLSNIAVSGKRNPVGVIAVLNNKCGWSDSKNGNTVTNNTIYAIPTVDLGSLESKFQMPKIQDFSHAQDNGDN